MKRTPSQEVAHTKFCAWVESDTRVPYILKGGAGTGKTYTTVNSIIATLNAAGVAYQLTSTTHQANDMLIENVAGTLPDSVELPITLHSLLGLVPTNTKQYRNPEQFRDVGYKMRDTQPNRLSIILVVDEAYRIDKPLYELLTYLLPNARLVLIGDPFQVPPVGSQESHIETLIGVDHTLQEAPRFVNGGILGAVVTNLRKAVESKADDYWNLIPDDNPNIYRALKKDVRTRVNELVDAGKPVADTEFTILCGTRKAEYTHNNYILRRREKAGLPLLQVGESYSIDTLIESHFEQQSEYVAYLRKQRKFTAAMLALPWRNGKYGIYAQPEKDVMLIVVTPWATASASNDFMDLVKYARKKGQDIVFLRLNIARTIHLAQGLTTRTALLDRDSVMAWANHNMRRRLLYTGVSRAASTLIHF